MDLLIDLHYLPTTTWFTWVAKADKIVLEKHEHFVKQTYRNRAHILTPQGIDALSVPLKGSQKKIPMCDIQIDNQQKWVNRHWRAIQSAYGKAPFFEHYADYFKQHIYANYPTLWELNTQLLTICLAFLQINTPVVYTQTYQKQVENPLLDLRSAIHPKKPFTIRPPLVYTPYRQVFGNKFVLGLSIIDLLFAEGPQAGSIIRQQAHA